MFNKRKRFEEIDTQSKYLCTGIFGKKQSFFVLRMCKAWNSFHATGLFIFPLKTSEQMNLLVPV